MDDEDGADIDEEEADVEDGADVDEEEADEGLEDLAESTLVVSPAAASFGSSIF